MGASPWVNRKAFRPANTAARRGLLRRLEAVEPKVAAADNVRAALQLVARGEAPLGIVYETDAKAEAGVKVVGIFPEESHAPIIYPIAPVAASTNKAAQDFLSFLNGAEAQAIFKQAGFTVLAGS